MRLPKENDGLKRDEITFYSQIWPKLEQERKRDKSVQSYEKMQFGKEIPMWTLK